MGDEKMPGVLMEGFRRGPDDKLQLLQAGAERGNAEDAHKLGLAHEHGDPDLGVSRRNLHLAQDYHRKAAEKGQRASQHAMAVILGTGVLSAAPDEPSAILHDHFAAMGGHAEAQAALGHRYHHGYGVPQSCENALRYYEAAAAQSVADARRIGVPPPHERVRLSEVAQLGRRAQRHTDAEVVQYYHHMSKRGDAAATRTLGHIHLHGLRGQSQNVTAAMELLRQSAEEGDPSAAGALGHLLLHGPLEKRDVKEALRLFKSSEEDAQSVTGLGFMSLRGLGGVKANPETALAYFEQAQKAGHSEAYYHTGLMLYEGLDPTDPVDVEKATKLVRDKLILEGNPAAAAAGEGGGGSESESSGGSGGGSGGSSSSSSSSSGSDDVGSSSGAGKSGGEPTVVSAAGVVVKDLPMALKFFQEAAKVSHLEATYMAGLMHARGEGTVRSCVVAVNKLKNVAERGAWGAQLMQAYTAWQNGESEAALWGYLRAAEAGSEVAQSNAAWLLDSGVCLGLEPLPCEKLALRMYRRASRQGRADAHVAVGDFYYYGRAGLPKDAAVAAKYYHNAADVKHPQALFNLGAMYQLGDGVKQDLHLAKRHYDLAITPPNDGTAAAPVMLALQALRIQETSQKWGRIGESLRRVASTVVKPRTDYKRLKAFQFAEGNETTAVFALWPPAAWLGGGDSGSSGVVASVSASSGSFLAELQERLPSEDDVLWALCAVLCSVLPVWLRYRRRRRRAAAVAAALAGL